MHYKYNLDATLQNCTFGFRQVVAVYILITPNDKKKDPRFIIITKKRTLFSGFFFFFT